MMCPSCPAQHPHSRLQVHSHSLVGKREVLERHSLGPYVVPVNGTHPAAKEASDRSRSGTIKLLLVVALTAIVAGITSKGGTIELGRHLALDVLERVAVDVAEIVPNTSALVSPSELELVDFAIRLARDLVYAAPSV